MSNKTGVYIYRIETEIWIGFASEFNKDSLHARSSEILNIHSNVLKCEDETDKSLCEYINDLIQGELLTTEMIPCSLGTFLEESIKRVDNKRQWRVLFSHLGEELI